MAAWIVAILTPSSAQVAWAVAGIALVSAAVSLWVGRIRCLRAERMLADATHRENYLRTIITSVPVGVATISRELRLLSINAIGLTFIEADDLAEARGADLREFIHPDDLADFVTLHDAVFAGASVNRRLRWVGRRGSERWMETFSVPLFDGDGAVVAHLAVMSDVTDRVAMDARHEAVRRSVTPDPRRREGSDSVTA